MTDGLPAVLTVGELAATLRIGRNQAYSLVDSGRIRAVRVGRSLRIPRVELERFLSGSDDDRQVRVAVVGEPGCRGGGHPPTA